MTETREQVYVPCLRWKQGEYQALLRLSPQTRSIILPLIDVAEVGFDFETRREIRSIDEHIRHFGRRVKEKWGSRECFIDPHHVDPAVRLTNGYHPVRAIFDDLRALDVAAIPVTSLGSDQAWLTAIKDVSDKDGRGICLRLGLEKAVDRNLPDDVRKVADWFGLAYSQVDLLLDVGAPNFEPLDGFVTLLQTIVRNLPHLLEWRSFTLLATSLPASLGQLGQGASSLDRSEWLAYMQLVSRLARDGIRYPRFGDYVINHPSVIRRDPRFLTTTANIRYTIPHGWLIVRGQSIKERGLGQHKDLCKLLTSSGLFCGASFSAGDEYIAECAKGQASTGNLTTWRWVGTSHHLEFVARDLANSAAP